MDDMIFTVHKEPQQCLFGEKLATSLYGKGAVIFLQGDLGAGKTTLARGFLKGLGYTGRVKSPTYTLIETYEIDQQTVLHIDLYRIQHPRELDNLGLQDYLMTGNNTVCLIEWPERALACLPSPDLICDISVLEETSRQIHITAPTEQGQLFLVTMAKLWD